MRRRENALYLVFKIAQRPGAPPASLERRDDDHDPAARRRAIRRRRVRADAGGVSRLRRCGANADLRRIVSSWRFARAFEP